MSKKFGGFLGGGPAARSGQAAENTGSLVRSDDDRWATYAEIAQEKRAQDKTGEAKRHCFAIALDATGSMGPLIDDARRSIGKILDRIYAGAKTEVRVRIYVYRDYDVSSGLCEFSDLTNDSQALSRWLASVRAHGGGANAGEAVEGALEAIYEADEVSALLLAGDEPSNSRESLNAYNYREKLSAREWASRFSERAVPIHTFVVGNRPDTKNDFELIAKLSGGQSGQLDGSDAMIDMASMVMLERLGGTGAVERYAEANRLSIGARDFARKLIAGPKK
jgi:hypothetical protein